MMPWISGWAALSVQSLLHRSILLTVMTIRRYFSAVSISNTILISLLHLPISKIIRASLLPVTHGMLNAFNLGIFKDSANDCFMSIFCAGISLSTSLCSFYILCLFPAWVSLTARASFFSLFFFLIPFSISWLLFCQWMQELLKEKIHNSLP